MSGAQKSHVMLRCLPQQRPRSIESGHRARAVAVGGSAETPIRDDFHQGVWIRVPGLEASQPAAVDDQVPASVIRWGGWAIAGCPADGYLVCSPRMAVAARQGITPTLLPAGVIHTSS